MNMQVYWREVRRIQAELPDPAVLVSVENVGRGWRGGVVSAAEPETAAKLIFSGSHRVATPAEIEAHLANEAERKATLEATASAAAGRTRITLPPAPIGKK
jgi:hypothetical protein